MIAGDMLMKCLPRILLLAVLAIATRTAAAQPQPPAEQRHERCRDYAEGLWQQCEAEEQQTDADTVAARQELATQLTNKRKNPDCYYAYDSAASQLQQAVELKRSVGTGVRIRDARAEFRRTRNYAIDCDGIAASPTKPDTNDEGVRRECLAGLAALERSIREQQSFIDDAARRNVHIEPIYFATLQTMKDSMVKARAAAVECSKSIDDQEANERRSAQAAAADQRRYAAEDAAMAKRRAATSASSRRARRTAAACLEANGLTVTSQRTMPASDGAVEMVSFDVQNVSMLLRLDKQNIVQGAVVLVQAGGDLHQAARIYFALGNCLTGVSKAQVSQTLLTPLLAKLGGAFFRTVKTSIAKFAIAWTESDVKELAKQ